MNTKKMKNFAMAHGGKVATRGSVSANENALSFLSVLVVVLVAAPALQYLSVHLQLLAQGNFLYWAIGADMAEDAGIIRYLKDVASVGFIAAYSLHLMRGRHVPYFIFAVPVSLFIIGLSGISRPHFLLGMMAGSRWIVHLTAAIMCAHYLNRISTANFRKIWSVIVITVSVALLLNFFVATVQKFHGFSIRAPGVFSNAAVMSVYVYGVMLLVFSSKGFLTNKLLLWLVYIVGLLSIIYSGSRAAMVLAVLFLPVYLVFSKIKLKRYYILINLVIMAPLFFLALNFADKKADRGSALEDNIQGGRLQIMAERIAFMQSDAPETLLIGRGLGFGTNTGISLAYTRADFDENWFFIADNGYLSMFTQYGVLGCSVIFMILLVGILRLERIRVARNIPVAYIYYPLFSFLMWGVTQNPLEQFGFLFAVCIAIGVALRSERENY